MPACYIDGVVLQPAGGAGVVLASADMVQPSEGDILVPIRAIPQKRLLCSPYMEVDGITPTGTVLNCDEGHRLK
jgi:hypothetical protein